MDSPLDPTTLASVRRPLVRGQLENPWSRESVLYPRAESDGKVAVPQGSLAKRQLNYVDRLRLSPQDELLEYQYINKFVTFGEPYVLRVPCQPVGGDISWRTWIFQQVQEILPGGAHRGHSQTVAIVARMAWWPELSMDVQGLW